MTDEEYNKFYNRFYAQAFRDVRNESDAEDIAQDAIVTFFRKRYQFEGRNGCALDSWAYRICFCAIGMFMRKKRQKSQQYKDDRPLEAIPELEFKDMTCQTFDPIDMKQFDKNLEPIEIQIIQMKYQGYSTKEIAQIMGKTIPSIKSRIHRLRLKILKPGKTKHIRDVKKIPEPPKVKYVPTIVPKIYKFTPSIKPKPLPKPRKARIKKHTTGTGDIRPNTWEEYFIKKAANG